jgi:ketosteroid isomerase-like protein
MESGIPSRDTAWAMSQENVEKVRAGFAAYNRGDLDTLMEMYDPEVEFVTLLQGNRHGKDALRLLFEENRNTMPGYRLDPEELIDAGDKVIALVRLGGVGRVSHIAMDDRIALLFTIKGGLAVRQQTFRNKDDALEAAGLSE